MPTRVRCFGALSLTQNTPTLMRYLLLLALGLLANAQWATAQHDHPHFDRQDTLRGSITPERAWWDLNFYHLDIAVDIDNRSLSGRNTIWFTALQAGKQVLQIDLQAPMRITRIEQNGTDIRWRSEGNAHFVTLDAPLQASERARIVVHYEGQPPVSKNPPWSGGVTWKKDRRGNDFVATSCQGDGASIWWPCKDHAYDEVDSMRISVRVPQHLTDVSNGRLEGVEEHDDGTHTFHWYVNNPINNYGVNINIGDYVHFGEEYKGEAGTLDCDYYVLRDNLEKARAQFKQVPMMLEAFEHWFGPYPFYEDGFKLVEAPYLGMEHQSSVTYGNEYKNGYLGRDLSATGEGLRFDFIIIHEAGHEWFANNITQIDVADMWIHEGFTAYSESLYLEYHFGKDVAERYVRGTRSSIRNDRPIIGTYGVQHEGSGDMYYKGANLLLMIRELIGDTDKWRSILRGLNREFYHQTVSSQQVEDYVIEQAGQDFGRVFDQYLRTAQIPTLEYRKINGGLQYRWINCVKGFDMPVTVFVDGVAHKLQPSAERMNWLPNVKADAVLRVHPNFYVGTLDVQP